MIPDTIDRHEWNSLDPNVTFHEWSELRRQNELLIAACKAAISAGPHNASHGLPFTVVDQLRAALAAAEPKEPQP